MSQVHVMIAESREPTIIDTDLIKDRQTSGKYLTLSGTSLSGEDKAPKSDGEEKKGADAGKTQEELDEEVFMEQLRKDYQSKYLKEVPTSMKNNKERLIKKMNEPFDPNDTTQNPAT